MSPAARGSVLVVDDEPTVTDVLSRYLEHAGYSAHVAADGPSALEVANESTRTWWCSI